MLTVLMLMAPVLAQQGATYRSQIAIYDVASRSSRVIHTGDGIIEAPNWSRDGRHLLVNTNGGLYRLPVAGGALERIPGLEAYRCNNDHDYSRDGKMLAFSAAGPDSKQSQVYVANADGTGVRRLTPAAPSYFHGWSPDGKWLAFVGQRNGKYELYRVSVNGGEEQRLTSAGSYDDGPDYSPDGKWIYFNSERSGRWEIWRMPATGAGAGDQKAERVTNDEAEDWFPHPSPDGRHLVWIAFPAGTKGHNGRMPGMTLRMMSAPGRKLDAAPKVETLATFYGGQGSINVNSWSPDSKQFAYVLFQPVDTSVTWQFDRLESIGGHAAKLEGAPRAGDGAIEFDGVDDAIFLETHPLAGAAQFTWEVIFRPASGGRAEQRFFHLQETGSENRLLFETRLINGQWCLDTFARTNTGSKALLDRTKLHALDQWHHVAAVYDGRTLRHYVNGVLQGEADVALAPQGPGRTSIGVRINRVDYFKGAVRTARFSRRALAPGEFLRAVN